jgi:hypothetical protein
MNEPIVLEGEQIIAFVLLQIYHKLKLEVEHPNGPKWRDSPMKEAKTIMERAGHPTTSRTKRKVLEEYSKFLTEIDILREER